MLNISPRAKIVIGVLLMVVGGVIVPLLMVIHIIQATFLLIFGSYAVSTSGLFLGIIGAAEYVRLSSKDK